MTGLCTRLYLGYRWVIYASPFIRSFIRSLEYSPSDMGPFRVINENPIIDSNSSHIEKPELEQPGQVRLISKQSLYLSDFVLQ